MMAVKVKLNKNSINKLQRELENEMRRRLCVGGNIALRKDSEKFLEIALAKRKETGKDTIRCDVNVFNAIPNIDLNIGNIMDDLKIHNCISSNSGVYINGEVEVILTMDGIDYFVDKQKKLSEGQKNVNSNTNNFYGEVTGVQIQQGTVNSSQTQTVSSGVDFEQIGEVVEKIKKYDAMFDEEYGDSATEMRNKIVEIEELLRKKENPGKIKILLNDIKNLSLNVGSSVIASGIIALLGMVLGG